MLTFAVEPLHLILHEVRQLWQAHWEETEGYREVQGCCPDLSQYLRLERSGMFVEYTARDEAHKLVGHLAYILHVSRHTSRLNAVEDYFYLLPQARAGFNALRLLRYAVEDLKKRGCCQIGMSSKLTNDIEPLLRRAGFQYVAKFFTMNVDENLAAAKKGA